MDIFAIAPFAAGSLKWQETPGQWTLTLVCKLTLALEPGVCAVAPAAEPIHTRDQRREGSRGEGIYAPSDLVPHKAYPEVLLVGRVTAPPEAAARGEVAHLTVGAVELTLPLPAPGEEDAEVPLGPVAARWPDRPDGRGPVTITFAPSAVIEAPLSADPDEVFFQSAPADQHLSELPPDEQITLLHLHPHVEHLATRLPGIRPRTRVEIEGMPPWELELSADTLWIDTDRSICTLTFRGQLPLDGRDQPGRIFIGVERPGEEVQFAEAPAETVRKPSFLPAAPVPPPPPAAGLLGQPLEEDDEDDIEQTQTNDDALGRTRAQPVPFATSRALPFGPGPSEGGYRRSAPPPSPSHPSQPGGPVRAQTHPSPAQIRSRTPTWLGGMEVERRTGPPGDSTAEIPAARHVPLSPPPRPSQVGGVAAPAPLAAAPSTNTLSPASHAPLPPSGAVPPARASVATAAGAPPPIRTPPPPPPLSQILRQAEPAPVNLAAASNRAAGLDEGAALDPYSAPQPAQGAPPAPLHRPSTPSFPAVGGTTVGQATVAAGGDLRPVPPPRPSSVDVLADAAPARRRNDPRALATAAFLGAADASTAAAGPRDDGPREKEKAPPAQPAGGTAPRTLIELLWFSPDLPPRLAAHEVWRSFAEPDRPPEAEEPVIEEELPPDAPPRRKKKPPPPPEKTPEEKARQERAHVTRVLARGAPSLDIEGALFSAATEDGVLEPPLLVVPGDLELPFDEVETLKVLVSAAAPLALGDKKLKETLDLANEALGTPLGSSPEVAASFSMRIREAWIRANRILSPDYLDVHTRRVLLEQRKYQLRDLMGAQWIRALLHAPMTERPVPAYLPAELVRRLPLFVKFPARLIAEALPAQDQNETHSASLRVFALSRAVTGQRGR